jgi:hypothetical protein
MSKKLTKFQEKLLQVAFYVMAKDMTYEHENLIMEKMGCGVGDLYKLEDAIEEVFEK